MDDAKSPKEIRQRALWGLAVSAVGIAIVAYLLWAFSGKPKEPVGAHDTVKVLSYSSFVSSWGPGPEIARLFQMKTGIAVEFQDAGDAGLLLKKIELFPSDVVLGFDQLSLDNARKSHQWREVAVEIDSPYKQKDFVPFDWGPMTFIYRKGEIDPPRSLQDLLDLRFKGTIALQDPRLSTPGLQFFYWVLDEYGIEEGFKYLEKLKPNIHSVSEGWSKAYGMFTEKQAMLAFSYLTSPVYHWTQEKNEAYQPAVFPEGHPAQVEYAAISGNCTQCEAAAKFLQFLVSREAQTIIMQKNFMLPIDAGAVAGTRFAELPQVKVREWKNLPALVEKRDELLERWRKLQL